MTEAALDLGDTAGGYGIAFRISLRDSGSRAKFQCFINAPHAGHIAAIADY
jgi:hypothetical protein